VLGQRRVVPRIWTEGSARHLGAPRLCADVGARTGARDLLARYERVVATEPPGPPVGSGPHRRVAAAILAYDIFPPSVGRGVIARSPVEVGDTVGLRYRLAGGLEMFFASR